MLRVGWAEVGTACSDWSPILWPGRLGSCAGSPGTGCTRCLALAEVVQGALGQVEVLLQHLLDGSLHEALPFASWPGQGHGGGCPIIVFQLNDF